MSTMRYTFFLLFFQIINMTSLDKLDKFRQVYLFYNQKIYVYALS